MMKAYTTLAGAERAAGSDPIIRLLHDPAHLFVTVPRLDTRIMVLTADSPSARGGHQFAGSVSGMDIVDAEIARLEIGHTLRELQMVPDATNANNRRITGPGDRHVCKVYGNSPDNAEAKARAILAALAILVR